MKSEKRRKLESAGWQVGDARELLDLTPDESEFVEMKLTLASRGRVVGSRRR